MIAEPGRFYAASAFSLATNIIAKKEVAEGGPNEETKDENSELLSTLPG